MRRASDRVRITSQLVDVTARSFDAAHAVSPPQRRSPGKVERTIEWGNGECGSVRSMRGLLPPSARLLGAFPARTETANAAYKAAQANPNEARTIGRGQGSRSTRWRQCARVSSSSMSAFTEGRLNRLQPGAPIRPRGSSCPAATSVLRTQLGLRQ